MALMLAETYKAFLEAGASEAQASKAASELAGYDSRLADIESTQRLHGWMLAYLVALLTAMAIKIFA